jgi:hypothetical protein
MGLIKKDGEFINKNQLEVYQLFFYRGNPLMITFEQRADEFYISNTELNVFCEA